MATENQRIRDFFSAKARGWEKRFPDDDPAYRAAVGELRLSPGGSVLDAGCGTGRALIPLREAVGASGVVVGADLTPAMLCEARVLGRDRSAALVEADASRIPLRNAVLDAVFAAGLVHHVPDAAATLAEFARVSRPGARLALFHPVGRAALAARHGHTLRADDVRAEPNLRPLLTAAGWELTALTDTDSRYLAVATRRR